MVMTDTTDHDQLFKEVIRDFFPDFLRLFFPDQAARFDLAQVHWLDKELFAAPPDGPRHLLDLVAELTLLGGNLIDTAHRNRICRIGHGHRKATTGLLFLLPAYQSEAGASSGGVSQSWARRNRHPRSDRPIRQ